MALVRFFVMLIWALVFIVLLLFAAKNVETVSLRFYFDRVWEAPLIVVLLGAFAAGAFFGLLAFLPTFVRQRRQIMGLKRELRIRDRAAATATANAATPTAVTTLDAPDVPPVM